MARHLLDVGFDRQAAIELGTKFYPLGTGLVAVTDPATGTGTPRWPTQFKKGDSLAFRIWDTTDYGTPDAAPVSFWIGFFSRSESALLADPLASGGDPIVVAASGLEPLDIDAGVVSSVFPDAQAGWAVGASPLGTEHTFDAEGRYVLRVRVEVKTASRKLRRYVHDPEIYIGPSGG